MIFDLSEGKEKSNTRFADFVIIGGGTAGLLLAKLLSDSDLSVIVLESGSKEQRTDRHPFNRVVTTGMTYSGAEDGRFRCLGGTSTRWGGAMIPFLRADLKEFEWNTEYDSVLKFIPILEETFQLNDGPYNIMSEFTSCQSDYIMRAAKWPSFRNRNLALLLKSDIENRPNLEVWLNATGVEFDEQSGVIKKILAKSLNNKQLNVEAKQVIIASGAIEATRMLLLLEENVPSFQEIGTRATGSRFSDHISAPIATLVPSNKAELNQLFGYQFEKKGVMRNIRFEMNEDSILRGKVPPHFFHVSFKPPLNSPFNQLRDFYRQVQQGNFPSLKNLIELLKSLPWLIRAAYWKFYKHRLLYPQGSEIEIHLVLEQVALDANTIKLSILEKDSFGIPLPEIHWKVSPIDASNFIFAAQAFQSFWEESKLSRIATFHPRKIMDEKYLENSLFSESTGIFHPTGTTPIGNEIGSSTVSKDLKVHGYENLYLVSTSILQTGCGANPTMTELLFAFRLADHLKSMINSHL